MSAIDELLKNLMQSAKISKSRKRPRDTVYVQDTVYMQCRNTKTRQESCATGSPTLGEKSLKPVAKN